MKINASTPTPLIDVEAVTAATAELNALTARLADEKRTEAELREHIARQKQPDPLVAAQRMLSGQEWREDLSYVSAQLDELSERQRVLSAAVAVQRDVLRNAEEAATARAAQALTPEHNDSLRRICTAIEELLLADSLELSVRAKLTAAGYGESRLPFLGLYEGLRASLRNVQTAIGVHIEIAEADDSPIEGLCLCDIPGVARVGEFVTMPRRKALALQHAGSFDTKASRRAA